MKILAMPVLAAMLLMQPQSASALCIGCSCSVTGISSVAFGTFNPLPGTSADAVGQFTVNCTVGLLSLLSTYTVDLTTGNSGSYSPRKMSSGANRLNYNLYRDAARTTVWGDGTGGTWHETNSSLLGIGTTTHITYDVYGRIQANQQSTPPGTYSDLVTIIVTLD